MIDDLIKNYSEYREKILNDPSPESLERYRQIYSDLTDINRRILEAIINIDRSSIGLTEVERTRMEQDEEQDRIIDRVLPYMILSQYIENNDNFEKNP
jgi:hypothetical protein